MRWSLQRSGLVSMCFFRSKSRNSNTRYSRLSECITSFRLQVAKLQMSVRDPPLIESYQQPHESYEYICSHLHVMHT